MLLIEYVGHTGHIGLMSLTDGHLGRHLEYFRTLNDAKVASVGFIKYNASTTRINKEKKTLKLSSRSFWFSTGLLKRFPKEISDKSDFEKKINRHKKSMHN